MLFRNNIVLALNFYSGDSYFTLDILGDYIVVNVYCIDIFFMDGVVYRFEGGLDVEPEPSLGDDYNHGFALGYMKFDKFLEDHLLEI